MTDAELLAKVKTGLFGTAEGAWRDELLSIYINEVKAFMKSAGVAESVLNSEVSVGCITLGVNDLWNYSSGSPKLSEYCKQRIIQLAAEKGEADAET